MSSEPKEIVRRGYDAVSERYRADDDEPAAYTAWLADLRAWLPPVASVLDLGCGCGVPISRTLAELGHDVVGVDISAVQVGRARRLVPAARFIRADAASLSFIPGSFEAIVCLYMLIHLPHGEQEALIRNLGSWLRPGGVLLATVGATAWTGEEEDWLGGGERMWWSHPGVETYHHWLTSAGLIIERDEFVPEGSGGHQLLIARRE
ncbi:class I SAM-dependent methyltransferase [Pseudonocardia yunnanensis]|uniref:Class I SAM-dependent methyltransferase n=1 Tax=Pseudonocardia yunnanensis TaxID=58107 RepID=A0ABW4EQW3_9PSEU